MAITMLCLAALILLVIMSLCRFMGLWTWTATWIFSSKEEKMNLTRSKGHYNANGYFVSVFMLKGYIFFYNGSNFKKKRSGNCFLFLLCFRLDAFLPFLGKLGSCFVSTLTNQVPCFM